MVGKSARKRKEKNWYIEDEIGPWGNIVATREGGKVPHWARKAHMEEQKRSGRSHVGITKKYI